MMRILTTINTLILQVQANDTNYVSADQKKGSQLFGIIGFLLVLTLVIVFATRPILKGNNIFMKIRLYNYGRGEQARVYQRARQRDTMAFCALANLAGIIVMIYLRLQLLSLGANYHVTKLDRLPLRLFGISLFCTLAIFLYSLVGEVEMDLLRNFKYSLKVWLSTMFAGPAVVLLINAARITHAGVIPYFYLKTLILTNGIGCVTLAALIGAVHYFTAKPYPINKKRFWIMLTTQAVLLFNTLAASLIVTTGGGWLTAWLCYAIIIGLCIRYYDLDTTVYSDVAYYEAD